MKRLKCIWDTVFSRVITYYILFALVIVIIGNKEAAWLGRVNYLKEEGAYPLLYLNDRALYNERQFRLAKKYYKVLIATVPYYEKHEMVYAPATVSRAYNMLAICEYYLGNSDEAVEFLKKAIQAEPQHYWLNYNLGRVYFEKGQYETALDYLRPCLSLKTKDLESSMHLDYVERWPVDLGGPFKSMSLATFRKVMINSLKLSILAYEKKNDQIMVKNMASTAFKFNVDRGPFMQYYMGLTTEKPDVDWRDFILIYNPSLNFVPIGEEKFFIKKYEGVLR